MWEDLLEKGNHNGDHRSNVILQTPSRASTPQIKKMRQSKLQALFPFFALGRETLGLLYFLNLLTAAGSCAYRKSLLFVDRDLVTIIAHAIP
jgi:hypothetical protein